MHTTETQISCPECGHNVDVNEILYRKLDNDLRKKYDEQIGEDRAKLQSQKNLLETAQRDLQSKRAAVDEQIAQGIQAQLNAERERITHAERKKAQQDVETSTALLELSLIHI